MKNWSKEKYSEELFKFNPDLKIISEFIKLREYIQKLDFKGKLECFSSNKIFDIIDSIKLKILEKIIQDKNI